MRITNKMMTNNMMSNINKNKLNMTTLEEQYSSGKKIQRPSDDPVVAVRALKLRTNLSEMSQYYEKNIPDAQSWMNVTESALTTVNSILTKVNTLCVQGSTDTLTAEDRASIAENLSQMKEQIYQEGNTNYAGRYVFTGFKTDSALTFTQDEESLSYSITQKFNSNEIQISEKVTGSKTLADVSSGLTDAPKMSQIYRIQLAYDNLSDTPPSRIDYYKKDASGELVEQTPITDSIIDKVSLSNKDAYNPAAGRVNYIPETGEIILGADVYEELRTADSIQMDYTKTGFKNGELKPEHYFNCTMTDSKKTEQDPIDYSKAESGQKIQYEVNYNQKLTINTEGSDAITHDIGRCIDDLLSAVNDVTNTEDKIKDVEERLKDTSLSDTDVENYTKLNELLNSELSLKKEVMQKAFSTGINISTKEQDRVNAAVADLGSREVRLELTENRLSSQKVDYEDLMSSNEDADVVDTYIKYGSAETIYNASLSAAGKVVKNTLLDFL